MRGGKPSLERRMTNEVVKLGKSGRGGRRPGAGRPPKSAYTKGKTSRVEDLRIMVMEALERNGGVAYLAAAARSHPAAFLSLLAKTLPHSYSGTSGDGSLKSLQISFVSVDQATVALPAPAATPQLEVIDAEVVEAVPQIATEWQEYNKKEKEHRAPLDLEDWDEERAKVRAEKAAK